MEENDILTKEFCDNNILLFYPKTPEEAEFIQYKIFEMGYAWGGSEGTRICNLEECVSKGMVLKHGGLYYNPDANSKNSGIVCTSEQFDKNYRPPLTLEQQIKELAAEVTALHATINAIYEAVSPKTIDKPRVSAPRKPKI